MFFFVNRKRLGKNSRKSNEKVKNDLRGYFCNPRTSPYNTPKSGPWQFDGNEVFLKCEEHPCRLSLPLVGWCIAASRSHSCEVYTLSIRDQLINVEEVMGIKMKNPRQLRWINLINKNVSSVRMRVGGSKITKTLWQPQNNFLFHLWIREFLTDWNRMRAVR